MTFLKGFPLDEVNVADSPVNPATNTVTSNGGTQPAQTGTLNAKSGTITTATMATTASTATTITITNAACTTNSTVFAVINSTTNFGSGAAFIESVVPGNGSFVIRLYTGNVVLSANPSCKIRFWILD